MENDKINLKQSKRPKFFHKKKHNLNLKKYIFTSYNDNRLSSYKKDISKNNNILNTISDYYYKNPYFYNDKNLNIQLKVLKELKNTDITRYSTPIHENTNKNTNHSSCNSHSNRYKNNNIFLYNNRTNYKNKTNNFDLPNIINKNKENNDIKIEINDNNDSKIVNNYSSVDNISKTEIGTKKYNSYKSNDEYFYKIVFKSKRLFKLNQKLVIDNKLNMIYAENEDQYKKIIDREYKRLISEGKKVKSKNVSPSIKLKLKETKNRIQFMKGIMDYSYPGFVLSKIKFMQKKLNEHKNTTNNMNNIIGMEKRNKEKDERNEFRKEYLLKCITLFK